MRAALARLADRLEEETPLPDVDGDEEKAEAEAFIHLIAAEVELIPSGHSFLVDGGDTILRAAVRAGFNIGYGCNDGSCGQCKARVIKGRVLETCASSYELSPHERQMGYALMCCNTAVTDLVLEVGETLKPDALPRQDLPARLSHIQALEDGMVMIRVKLPKNRNFRFFAGQNAQLCLPTGETASLPIISCPCDGSDLQMVVDMAAVPAFGAALASNVGVGEGRLSGPSGTFVLQEQAHRPSLFLACGTGFSPIRSLLEHGVAMGRIEAFHLWRFAPADAPLYLENCCRAWADSMENFRYQRVCPDEDMAQTTDSILKPFSSLEAFDAYVAGPKPFLEAALKGLKQKGLPDSNLRFAVTSR